MFIIVLIYKLMKEGDVPYQSLSSALRSGRASDSETQNGQPREGDPELGGVGKTYARISCRNIYGQEDP